MASCCMAIDRRCGRSSFFRTLTPSGRGLGVVYSMIDPRIVEAYEKHSTDLMFYATALIGPSEAEDVVADAMLRVFRTSNWDRVLEPRGYLFRCVLNEATRRSGANRRDECESD